MNSNPEKDLAWRIISTTDTNLFLTGKAGTGKTTFLHELREKCPKRMVVVAPTGIAAINAHGSTIHSFFQLGFGPQIPGTTKKNSKNFQFRKQKIKLIRSLSLVVIDEISMVRADILDAIDGVLRQYRDRTKPFGGVQMLMIGDMQQLAPVAREDEWRLLSPYYDTPYFFSSHALQESHFVSVELQTVYRQSDPMFLELLNKVRTNTADLETLAKLNERYIPNFIPAKEDRYIRLTTHNAQAQGINDRELKALPGQAETFEATIDGDFPEMSYPTDKSLELKVGAQVMFIKNDSAPEKRYYNGLIGEVVDFNGNVILVRPSNGEETIKVGKEKWENIRYNINEETKEIEEEVIGSFEQYPLKTAWAITVHKSQGLTFEHAIIDVQHSFAHGQTYVALSRCKTFEGMVLGAPIPPHAIINDATVTQFSHDPNHQQPDNQAMDTMQRNYLLRTVEDLFSFMTIHSHVNEMIRLMREYFYDTQHELYTEWIAAEQKVMNMQSVALRFHNQYQPMILTLPGYEENADIQDRLRKGAAYFSNEITTVGDLLNRSKLDHGNKQVRERIDNLLENFKEAYNTKFKLLYYVAEQGLNLLDYLKTKDKLATDGAGKEIVARRTRTMPKKKPSPKDEPGHVEIDQLPY